MKIYIAIIDDRQCDTQAHPFGTPEKAIEFVMATAARYWPSAEDVEPPPGWLCYVRDAENSAWVVETQLDESDFF
jgi:hypothetical protein